MSACPGPAVKVLFDWKAFQRQEVGGVSRYFVELVRHLALIRDCQPAVLAPLHVNRHLLEADIAYTGWKAPRIGYSTPLLGALNRLLATGFAEPGVDLVHETYYSRLATPPRELPRVTTVHDMIHELYPQYFSRIDSTSRRKRVTVERADAVICVSHATRRDLIDRFDVDAAKVFVVHLANSLVPAAGAAPRPGRPYVLYVGHRAGYKNFRLLLDAFARDSRLRRDLGLVCFGGGSPTAGERAAIAAAGLAENVRFTDGTDGALAICYAQALVHVCPSRYEGFGLTLLEAMANGCAIVAANAGSLPEVAGDAAAYFDPEDAGTLAAALNDVAFTHGRREALVAAAKRRVGQFSWRRCAAETFEVYRKVLSR